MRKLTECLIVLAFLLCAFTAQAASEIDVSVPSAGEPCTSDLSCAPGELCVNDICSVTRPCTNDFQCDPGELCIDDICRQGECVNDEDCEGGLICDKRSFACVECITWKNCAEGEICTANNTCVLADDCDLKIQPKVIKINKTNKFTITVNKDTDKEKVIKLHKAFKFKVKGSENFYPFRTNPDSGILEFDFDISPVFQTATKNRWYAEKQVVEISAGINKDEKSGTYTVRVGTCLGKIKIENQNIITE